MKPYFIKAFNSQITKFILALFLVTCSVKAADVHLNQTSLSFATSYTSVTDSLSFWIVNDKPNTIYVTDINTFAGVFNVRDTSRTILPNDSARVWVYFSSIHNLTYADVGVVEFTGTNKVLCFTLSGTKQYPDSYYSSTQGLSGEGLKTALKNLVTGQTNRHYDGIRDLMFLQVDTSGGQLECVYTGRKIPVTTRSDMQNTGNFNTEHSWPQSNFNQQEPERADINHLFPADETANNKRSNYPFDVVTSTPSWSVGGSKLGQNINNVTVFEPRDVHKGDLARGMFYFIVRYQNWGSFWTSPGVNQEATFRIWNKADPVSAKEIARNNAIAQPNVQGKRNPFIDHPEFVDRISSFASTAVVISAPKIISSPSNVNIGHVAPGDTGRYQIAIMNAGNAALSISSITTSNSVFSVNAQTTTIPANNYTYAELRFIPITADTTYTGAITINSNDGTTGALTLTVTGISDGVSAVGDTPNETPHAFILEQNYPNPFNPVTEIRYSLPSLNSNGAQAYYVTLKITDVLGKEVATLVDGVQGAGIKTASFDASTLPSGIYFYTLTAGSFSEMKKMILTR